MKILLLFLALVIHIRAEEYWVSTSGSNNNPGTFQMPFLTIQKALDTVSPYDSISIMEGVYSISDGLTVRKDHLLLRGSGDVVIDGKFINSNKKFFNCNLKTNIIIDNLTIQNLNYFGIWIDGDSCIVRNCTLTNTWHDAINIIGASYCLVSNNQVYNVGTGTIWGNSITLEGKVDSNCNYKPCSFNIIENNTITKNDGHFGINMEIIYANEYTCLNDTSVMTGNIIRYNEIDSCWSGMYIRQSHLFEIYDNIIAFSDSRDPNYEGHGIKLDKGKRDFIVDGSAKIYNNTVAWCASSGLYNASFKNLSIYNNVIHQVNLNNHIGYAYVRMDETDGIVLSNNSYYGSNLCWNWNMTKLDSSEWSAIESIFYTAEPGFVNETSGNFELTENSTLRSKGINLKSFHASYNDIDINGNKRPSPYNEAGNVWDIGAYEYYGLVSVKDKLEDHKTFILYNNYPNPFNPSTKIRYALPGQRYVTLIIYDLLGNEIAVLKNEEQAAGEYQVDFISANLSSGVYFYKITAGELSVTKKMILMR